MPRPVSDALDALFNPRRVAVVGASDERGKTGTVVMRNLKGFRGEVVPITRSAHAVAGWPAATTLSATAGVDLAVIVVPARAVPEVIRDAVTAGVRTAVVISAGFAEAGPEGAALQAELVAAARDGWVRVVGPNCFGVLNCDTGLNASISTGTPPAGGGVALVTQSGAYGMAIYTTALEQQVGFSKVYAAGNKADLTDAEVLEYLARDPQTRVICLFLESVSGGQAFLRQAALASREKPLVVAKTGRTEAGSRAAQSHTAAIAGRAPLWRDLLDGAGAVGVGSGQEMLDVARALDFQPAPAGRRVGVVTNSGGTGVELTDLLEEQGLQVPELSREPRDELRRHLPAYASPRNPVDLTPVWARYAELYPLAIEALARSGEVDAVVAVLLQRSALDPEVIDAVIAGVSKLRDQGLRLPVYVCWIAPREGQANLDRLQRARIPVFDWPERTARALAGAARAGAALRRPADAATLHDPSYRPPPLTPGLLAPAEAAGLLEAFGIPVVPWRLCATEDEAVTAAAGLGYPCVAKAVGPIHKTEVGGVRVGLADPAQLREATRDLLRLGPEVLLQRQAAGVEVAVGGVRDPELGPLVMVGMGGVLVEVLQDVRFGAAPAEAEAAERALRGLRGFPLLRGARGARPADVDALIGCVTAVSRLLAAIPEIGELDLNPVFAAPAGVQVADARIVVSGPRG
jgi:acetyltransferase